MYYILFLIVLHALQLPVINEDDDGDEKAKDNLLNKELLRMQPMKLFMRHLACG